MLRVRIEIRRGLDDAQGLRDWSHDIDSNGLGNRQVRTILEHVHVEPGVGQRLLHILSDSVGARSARHVRLTRHRRVKGGETLGRDRIAELPLQGSLPLEGGRGVSEVHRRRRVALRVLRGGCYDEGNRGEEGDEPKSLHGAVSPPMADRAVSHRRWTISYRSRPRS